MEAREKAGTFAGLHRLLPYKEIPYRGGGHYILCLYIGDFMPRLDGLVGPAQQQPRADRGLHSPARLRVQPAVDFLPRPQAPRLRLKLAHHIGGESAARAAGRDHWLDCVLPGFDPGPLHFPSHIVSFRGSGVLAGLKGI